MFLYKSHVLTSTAVSLSKFLFACAGSILILSSLASSMLHTESQSYCLLPLPCDGWIPSYFMIHLFQPPDRVTHDRLLNANGVFNNRVLPVALNFLNFWTVCLNEKSTLRSDRQVILISWRTLTLESESSQLGH